MSSSLHITFLGTGTSQGVPVIACDCEICRSNHSKDKRLRSSILIHYKNENIVVDTGPDFRQQMLTHKIKQLDAILFSHEHKDHTAGLDDVRAFNFVQKKDMDIYVNEAVKQCLFREYHYAFGENLYPGVPKLNLIDILPDQSVINIKDIDIQIIKLLHHKLEVLGFRINDFAYCTDVNYIAPEEKLKLNNLAVLVIPALRREKHLSHFNLEEALALVEELQPKKAYFTHISHYLGKHDEVEKELPPNVFLAYDGLTLTL